jgi:hypothetical protein
MDNSNQLYTILDVVGVNLYSYLLPSELHALTLTSSPLSHEVPKQLVRTCTEVFSKSVGYSVEDKDGNHFSAGFAHGNASANEGDVVTGHLQHIHRDGLRIRGTRSAKESLQQATSLLREDKTSFLPFTHPEGDGNVVISPKYDFIHETHRISKEDALSSMWVCKCKVKKTRDFVRRAWVYRHLGINKNLANTFTRLDLIRAWVYCLLRLKQNRILTRSSFSVTWHALDREGMGKDTFQLDSFRERTDTLIIQSELGDMITLEQYQLRV